MTIWRVNDFRDEFKNWAADIKKLGDGIAQDKINLADHKQKNLVLTADQKAAAMRLADDARSLKQRVIAASPQLATAPAAAARLVVMTTSAKWRLVAFSVEPGLKPNQPNQRMRTPSWAIGMLWPGIAFGFRFRSYLPIRGPSRSSPAKPAVAPVR